jgi:uncharacterized protein
MIMHLPVVSGTSDPIPDKPFHAPAGNLMLFLTEDCNLRCTYCYVNKKPRRMSSETARKAVEFFLDSQVSGKRFQLTLNFFGGEPFLELDRMEEVIGLARRRRPNVYKKFGFSATTNGTIAHDRVEKIIRDSRMNLLISLDGGPQAQTSRPFVSGNESWSAVRRNLPRLLQWSSDVMVRMTFHPGALDLVGNVRQVLELGVPAVALAGVSEADWSGKEEAVEQAYQELADWFLSETRQGRTPPLVVTQKLLRLRHGGKRPERACNVGTGILAIDPDGNVMPCHRFLYRPQDWLGSADSPQLSPQRAKYAHLSSAKMPECQGCVAEPVCGGGCRVLALNAGRGLHQTHPGYCLLTRAHARAVYRIYDTLKAENSPALNLILRGAPQQNALLEELG